ncbi:MAG: DUF3108 domain-containing protein [Elusimicrobiota bacterium]
MKRLIFSALLFLPVFSYSQKKTEDQVQVLDSNSTDKDIFKSENRVSFSTHVIKGPSLHQTAFCEGEKLIFTIKYEFVGAGQATMEVNNGDLLNGRPTYQFVSTAKSNGFIDKFFRVRDFNASRVDQQTMYTLSFHQNLQEGHYKVIRDTHYDYANKTYYYKRQYKGKKSEKSGPVEKGVHDILSAFFVARTLPLKLGEEYKISVFSDGDMYDLNIQVQPKLQNIKVPAGKFECVRIDPFIIGDGIFKAKEGRMSIWLTNDERKMPVLIRSRVLVGAFDAELSEYTRP